MPKPSVLPIAPAVPDSALLAAVLQGVLALHEDLAQLRDEVAALRGSEVIPTHQPDAAIGALLQAIATTAGRAAFSSAELVEHAALPAAASLRAAIVATVGTVNPRRLGKVLRAIEGRDMGGLQIIREGMDREGVIWRVAEVTSALPLPPR